MVKVKKIENSTNRNPDLKCEFCGEPIPLEVSFFSVILPVPNNPPKNYVACEKCADEYRQLEHKNKP